MDNFNYLPTRDTCVYHMDSSERQNLEYADGFPIYDIIFQCQRYVQYCCGLTCCSDDFKNEDSDTSTLYRKIFVRQNTPQNFQFQCHLIPFLIFVLFYLY